MKRVTGTGGCRATPWPPSKGKPGSTIGSVMPKATKYFRVDDLVALVRQLRQDSEHVEFAWVMDRESNRVELREPPAGS